MNEVIVAGKRIPLDAGMAIGKGGEADVYAVGGVALKVYKDAAHPDYQGLPDEQHAATARLAVQQEKLRRFPLPLPERVIQPREVATDRTGAVVGYTMRLLERATPLARYADRAFRAGVGAAMVTAIFRDLHATVTALHRAGVVIGDFNDQNVLVRGAEAYLIDVDSYQFGPYTSTVFTPRFVDPLLCALHGAGLTLVHPYTPDSDWYAFAALLLQSLLFVDPYGGVYAPPPGTPPIPPGRRPLHRITVFHQDVRYPKPALDPRVLSDGLLAYLRDVLIEDRRGVFPDALLGDLRWRACPACGLEHAGGACPGCGRRAAPPLPAMLRVRRVFDAGAGTILTAVVVEGTPRWLWHDGACFRREDGSMVAAAPLRPGVWATLEGQATLIDDGEAVWSYRPGWAPERIEVDRSAGVPLVAANARGRYWAHAGTLWRDGRFGPEAIGTVLPGQTRFWVGEEMGFGFSRAGRLSMAFVFDPARRGLNDTVALLPVAGQIIDAACVFGAGRAWFLFAERRGGRSIHRCLVIRAEASIEASAEAEAGDGSWLGTLHGRCAAGSFLLAATDEGIVRVEPRAGDLVVARRFAETEPWVDAASALLPAPGGLYVVNPQEIRHLQLG